MYKALRLLKLNTLTERLIWSQTVADVAGETTKAIEEAKPIASSTIKTISSADPIVIAGTAGALFLAYLLLPPVWSALSFSLRGYQGIQAYYEMELLHVCITVNIFETRINNGVFCLK